MKGEDGSKRKEKKDGRGNFGNKKVSRDMGEVEECREVRPFMGGGRGFSFRKIGDKEAWEVLGRFGRNYGGGEGSNLTGKLRVKGTLIILIFLFETKSI